MKARLFIVLGFAFTLVAIATIRGCKQPADKGEELYQTHCGNCHGSKGQGFEKLYPPVAHSDYLTGNPADMACLIYNGFKGEMMVNGAMYDQPMPENTNLSEHDMANIINFIYEEFNNRDVNVTSGDVLDALDTCTE